MLKENSKEKLLRCAAELFSASGFDSVSVNDITAMAGITKPTLYHFFGSKEGLIKELLSDYFEKFIVRLSDISRNEYVLDVKKHGSVNDVLFKVLAEIAYTFFDFMVQNKEFAFIFVSMQISFKDIPSKKLFDEENALVYEKIGDLIKQIVYDGITKVDSKYVFRFINYLCGEMYLLLREPEYKNAFEYSDAVRITERFVYGS